MVWEGSYGRNKSFYREANRQKSLVTDFAIGVGVRQGCVMSPYLLTPSPPASRFRARLVNQPPTCAKFKLLKCYFLNKTTFFKAIFTLLVLWYKLCKSSLYSLYFCDFICNLKNSRGRPIFILLKCYFFNKTTFP